MVLEKIDKIDKALARLTKKKRRQITNNIRNERGAITTDPLDLKGILKVYYEQICAYKFDNMDQFLQRYNLTKLIQGGLNSLNRHLPIKEIESIIRNLLKKKTSSPDGFNGKFYQTFKEEIIPILQSLPEDRSRGKLPGSFYQAKEESRDHINR